MMYMSDRDESPARLLSEVYLMTDIDQVFVNYNEYGRVVSQICSIVDRFGSELV